MVGLVIGRSLCAVVISCHDLSHFDARLRADWALSAQKRCRRHIDKPGET